MTLRFLGTRGEIEVRTRRHQRHSSLLVAYRGRAPVLIDCGLDWRGRLEALRPQAIVLTHAHPDHAGGLRDGAPCPVYATEETWTALRRYPLDEQEQVRAREPFAVGKIRFEAFGVEHSLLAPAVGYRIEAGRAAIFYVPDLVSIDDERVALRLAGRSSAGVTEGQPDMPRSASSSTGAQPRACPGPSSRTAAPRS